MLTFGSLFTGIGGFDLGFERAGMRCLWQVEIDAYCNKVLERHWPDVRRLRDIRDCGSHNLPPVDTVCGGFPCQPFSLSGNRRGKSDDRFLWPEMLRVVAELKPSWVVAENVFGFISLGLDDALADLEAEGYEARPVVFPACAVGAPHRRDRVFVLAYSPDGRRTPTHAEKWNVQEPYTGGDVPNTDSSWQQQPQGSITEERGWLGDGGEADVSQPNSFGRQACDYVHGHAEKGKSKREFISTDSAFGAVQDWWGTEPRVGRVVDGLSTRLDRFRCRKCLEGLGNALVPQVAQVIGHYLVYADAHYRQNDADVL